MTEEEIKTEAKNLWDHMDSNRYEGATAAWFNGRAFTRIEELEIMDACIGMMREKR